METVLSYFELLPQNLHRTVEKHEKSQDRAATFHAEIIIP
jgi:hypothetical protein